MGEKESKVRKNKTTLSFLSGLGFLPSTLLFAGRISFLLRSFLELQTKEDFQGNFYLGKEKCETLYQSLGDSESRFPPCIVQSVLSLPVLLVPSSDSCSPTCLTWPASGNFVLYLHRTFQSRETAQLLFSACCIAVSKRTNLIPFVGKHSLPACAKTVLGTSAVLPSQAGFHLEAKPSLQDPRNSSSLVPLPSCSVAYFPRGHPSGSSLPP